jgi:hypothetical protein
VDESRDVPATTAEVATEDVVRPVTAAPVEPAPARQKRSWKGPLGLMAALVLSFAWGALTYRELGATRVVPGPVVAAAVAGSESAPAWIGDFATAFCDADAEHVASRIGPPLAAQADRIAEAFASREWSCADTRYLGGGENARGQFYAYVTIDSSGGEQWWVFTVVDERVVAIE